MSAALNGINNPLANISNTESTTTNNDAFASLSSEDFISVMITELTNQDPLEPNDSQAILEQLSSLRNIESDLAMQESLEALVNQNSIAQAGGLIGQLVSGLTENNDNVTGLVNSVRVVDGEAVLQLDDGSSLPLDRVTEITTP